MRIRLFPILCLLTCTLPVLAQARLDFAVSEYRSGRFDSARQAVKNMLFADGPDQEAATYLMVRIALAEGQHAEAVQFAENLIARFPLGRFAPYAHYAHAEALYSMGETDGATQELEWVKRNSSDRRLSARATRALKTLSAEPDREAEAFVIPEADLWRPEHERLTLSEGRVALLLSFPDPDDPAALDLERGFRFAADYGDHPFPATVVRAHSPFEAAGAARDLMEGEDVLLILFAGDEGSAMSITLLSHEYRVPLIKLTSSALPFTGFSTSVFEFLPSSVTQALELGRFAADIIEQPCTLMLTPESDEGRAGAQGFSQGIVQGGGTVDASSSYPVAATSVRSELAAVFSAEPRLARGEPPLQALLSERERIALFGDPEGGEVLVDAPYDTTYEDTISTREAFFFALSPENIDNFSSQLSAVPKRTTLFGNSSWIDASALERQTSVTSGMYIVAPLLPEVPDTSEYIQRYVMATGLPPNAWELLGLDAGEYTGLLLSRAPDSRADLIREMKDGVRFIGLSAIVDFSAGRENRFARILRHRRGELIVVR